MMSRSSFPRTPSSFLSPRRVEIAIIGSDKPYDIHPGSYTLFSAQGEDVDGEGENCHKGDQEFERG